jgi:hypothetical protein
MLLLVQWDMRRSIIYVPQPKGGCAELMYAACTAFMQQELQGSQ